MQEIEINFRNCYGIKKLETKFDFSSKSVYAIYAPNGMMKTSFAKTFKDLSNSVDSKDLVFKDRETERIITDENGALESKKVFVIEPYNEEFKSEKLSTLLVNQALKEKYDEIHLAINTKKDALIKELILKSGVKKEIETIFSNDFTNYPDEFYKALLRVKIEVLEASEPELADIKYVDVFSDKTIAFLETKDFKEKIKEYIEKYNELIDSSTYFKKGIFNHNNASVVAKNLNDNGFFQAEHSITLNPNSTNKIISSEDELEELIDEEKEAIINNPDLAKVFEDIDKKLKANKELRDFRDFLLNNLILLPELNNINGLKQKLWISYLKQNKSLYIELEEEFSNGKSEIEAIVNQAKEEETNWRGVIEEFNRRFSVPFKLKVENQEDVILKSEAPNIKFDFVESQNTIDIKENELLMVLSNGEKRALYILNIIFEVEARIRGNQETVFIVDDIADSFDYKNKYAIIEYLKDIAQNSLFKQIVLTHNFDFFRTISSRLDMYREHKLHTVKTEDEVILKEEKYQNNPFVFWKTNLNNIEMLIASIPFVRNIAEYTGDEANMVKLTSLLHIKEDTSSIQVNHLELIFKDILKDLGTLILPNQNATIIDLIFSSANSIVQETIAIVDLEKKIVLAIAIRLKSEQHMINKINNPSFVSSITKNQTSKLFRKYIELFSSDDAVIKLLNQVNLMTPENIHVNSFMYEPILDMDNIHLKELYTQVNSLV